MNHYPPNRMINVLNCLFIQSLTKFDGKNSTLLRFIMAKSSFVSMRFDEFKLLTRKSCFCLACNKSFPSKKKGKKGKDLLFNLMDNFVCSPFWLVSWCDIKSSTEGKSCLINILSASFPFPFRRMSKKY